MTTAAAPALAWAEARLADLGAAGPWAWSPLPVEASNRLFFRVVQQPPRVPARDAAAQSQGAAVHRRTAASYILMASPPAQEQNGQFLRLARLFRARGIGVPEVLAVDETEGWFVLEDLGTRHLADVYDTADRQQALAASLETLHRLQAIDDPAVPPYLAGRFVDELRIFTDWFVEGLLAEASEPGLTSDTFGLLVANAQAQPQCCVHRDFHCRNLLLRPDGGLGVVDFQDALVGPASYDLASLLRDCYHVFDEAEVARWRDAWLARSPLPVDPAAFPRQLDLTAVQRQLKAVGIFARLAQRDGKSTHLQWILPVLDRLVGVSERYRDLAPLADWLRRLRPLAARRLAVHR